MMTVHLVPGQIAAGLPADIPVPAGGRLVGSLVRQSGNTVFNGDVVIDAPQPASEALAIFDQALPARGWTKNSMGKGGQPAGFQPSITASSSAFCKSASGPFLSVISATRSGAPTDVRLHFEMTTGGPCASAPNPPPPGMTGNDVLPPLHAPDGVILQLNGGGGGPNRWTSEANAETDKSAAELEAHFARQLLAAGWTRTAGSSSGPLAWSTWKLPRDGDWSGFLFALEAPGQHRRALYARAESATGGAQGGWSGWSSYAQTTIAPIMAPPPQVKPAMSVGPAPGPSPAPALSRP
jgi:hypothetical protein